MKITTHIHPTVYPKDKRPFKGYGADLSIQAPLQKYTHSTFFVEIGAENTESVLHENTYLGVRAGDTLVVDRFLSPTPGKLVLVVCGNSFRLCRFVEHEGRSFFVCGENTKEPEEVTTEGDVKVWGVVSALTRNL